MIGWVLRLPDARWPYGLLDESERFGFLELDLVRPPNRFWADRGPPASLGEPRLDAQRVRAEPSPAELLRALPPGDTWTALSRRSLGRLRAWFLVAEDPQRRLDVQPVSTLAHQASLVEHVLQQPNLARVLLADEVGLGKTVEAGLLLKELLGRTPGLRVLYLAPARLCANVRRELDRLDLGFRLWVSSDARDGTLRDPRLIASLQRASHKAHFDAFAAGQPWDVIVVDEAHHLSDWAEGGGKPVRKYRLVAELARKLQPEGRLVLMTGTPHQGHQPRFENLLELLRRKGEPDAALAGRVIYRTKDDVRDWDGRPLFPARRVHPPIVVDLGDEHRAWLRHIHAFYEPQAEGDDLPQGRRAAGWRAGQALQWATSSVQAGLGYLVRQAIRAGFRADSPPLAGALAAIRPYRGGDAGEPAAHLFERVRREIARQADVHDLDDIEDDEEEDEGRWRPDPARLAALLEEGVRLLRRHPDAKWEALQGRVLSGIGDEKVVLFAQPIETVTALAGYLERLSGRRPALIMGSQSDREREREIEAFWRPDGPQFLVSSRAGGEGLNLQIARRLVHVDVPWNPMELEQRVGRVHRFMSKRTILVDTIVVKDSREVDCFEVARDKLLEIASTLVPADRFEGLFARVMALVPPEELQSVLARRPLAPFTDDERRRVADLVTRGFAEWQDFHRRYADQEREIRGLDAGQATWEDLAAFAAAELGAEPAPGFTSLRFLFEAGEIVEASAAAPVLSIGGRPYACGDFGGMPVQRQDGARAERLGLNVDVIGEALRAQAFPDAPAGAAHLRWPEGRALPLPDLATPFGVLVLARQSVRFEQGALLEHGTSMHAWILGADGDPRRVPPQDLGVLVRALLAATVRREPERAEALVEALQAAEGRLIEALRHVGEADRQGRIRHVALPLVAAVVAA